MKIQLKHTNTPSSAMNHIIENLDTMRITEKCCGEVVRVTELNAIEAALYIGGLAIKRGDGTGTRQHWAFDYSIDAYVPQHVGYGNGTTEKFEYFGK